MVKEEEERRWLAEPLVWAFCVGEHEPLGRLPVEESEVGEEEILVIVDEGLLESAVESLGMGVHLGRLGVSGPGRIHRSARAWAKLASNSRPFLEGTTSGDLGKRLKARSRVPRVCDVHAWGEPPR